MRQYLDTLRQPQVARLLFSQLVARFPAGMLSLAFFIHAEQTYGEYSAAGFTIAALGIGQSISGPLAGRLLSLFGMRRLLVPSLLVCAAMLLIVGALTLPLPVMLVAAFIVGLSTPPVPSAVRTVYPKLVSGPRLSTLFTMDATLQELIWVLGPLATTTLAATLGTRAGIIAGGVILLLGGVWFVTSPPIGQVRIPRSPRRLGAVLGEPVLLIMTGISLFAIGSWGALDAAAVARFGHDSPMVGILLGLSAVGSLVGGLIAGALPVRRSSLTVRVAIAVVGTALALVLIDAPEWLWVGYFLAGAACAPIIAIANAAVASRVRFSDTAEAYGWLGTAQLVGGSAASAIAGVAIDAQQARGGMLVAVGFVVAALLVALMTYRHHPDLGGDLEPRPDTMPVVLPDHVGPGMPDPLRDRPVD